MNSRERLVWFVGQMEDLAFSALAALFSLVYYVSWTLIVLVPVCVAVVLWWDLLSGLFKRFGWM